MEILNPNNCLQLYVGQEILQLRQYHLTLTHKTFHFLDIPKCVKVFYLVSLYNNLLQNKNKIQYTHK